MRFDRDDRKRHAGFSLVELLVVVAIILVISAVAAPNVIQALNAYRLRSALQGEVEIIQRARMEAMKDNRIKRVGNWWTCGGGACNNAIFIDQNGNWMQDATETTAYRLPTYIWSGWGPSTNSMNLEFTPSWGLPSFDARGIPCQFSGANNCPSNVGGQPIGFVSYLQFVEEGWWSNWAKVSYAAVSISPSGRIQTYIWDGTQWQQ
jgi:prepilin-type N-terminal cleavage/methylation domain-containing protein